ncbi:MAG: methyltransferase MtaB domain-containing protein [Capsulimonadaceae bacterium]
MFGHEYPPRSFDRLAVESLDGFLYGRAPKPVTAGHGLEIGAGTVIPEINFTLPPMTIDVSTWPQVRRQYEEIVDAVVKRAVALEAPGLLVEFETLPPMTVHPEWGIEITRILADSLRDAHVRYGMRSALRLTPNDTREHERPPHMRSGRYWDAMAHLLDAAAGAGADLLSIESTGGKEICDTALMNADLRGLVYALGVLAPRDMEFLWDRIVAVCRRDGIVPAGDTACGFANTAMAMAEQRMLPRTFAAIVRVASVPRSLVAFERGAVGPSKDCAYEGPYLKAIAGVPISMEGRAAACAHLSAMGNIAQAVCDCWSNESVQNVRLLSAAAPVVSVEHLIYDCRLLNAARAPGDVARMRDWLTESDAAFDPQAFVLRPDIVLQISREIVAEPTAYARTRCAVLATIAVLKQAHQDGRVKIPANEVKWLDRLDRQSATLPESEDEFTAQMAEDLVDAPYRPEEYGLPAKNEE